MWTEPTAINTITYEQPLNEQMRICLRLEHLFHQLNHHIAHTGIDNSKTALAAILKTLEVAHRPDLKSKLLQCLTQHATTLAQLEPFPQVDPIRLKSVLKKLDHLITTLHSDSGRIGERLRKNEFLNQVRISLGNPGGACAFSNPAYALWLRKPDKDRLHDLNTWALEFSVLRDIVDIILQVTRQSNTAQAITARDGFYHQTMNAALPCDLVRVNVPMDLGIYPEFSVGRHRMTIRFLIPNYQDSGRPQQSRDNINFDLTCCRV